MRMPGFTAEAGLREATTGYWVKPVAPYEGAVFPSMLRCLRCGPGPFGGWVCFWTLCGSSIW